MLLPATLCAAGVLSIASSMLHHCPRPLRLQANGKKCTGTPRTTTLNPSPTSCKKPAHSPQQVAPPVDILPVIKLTAGVQLRVVVQQLYLTRLQHVVQPKLITGSKLVEHLSSSSSSAMQCESLGVLCEGRRQGVQGCSLTWTSLGLATQVMACVLCAEPTQQTLQRHAAPPPPSIPSTPSNPKDAP